MQFFLHEIVARVVAAYLLIEGSRALWHAVVARKLSFEQDGVMERLFNVPDWVTHRDTNPLRYWFLFGLQVITLIAFLVVAIFGWWTPKT
jgi:hypothetical protein